MQDEALNYLPDTRTMSLPEMIQLVAQEGFELVDEDHDLLGMNRDQLLIVAHEFDVEANGEDLTDQELRELVIEAVDNWGGSDIKDTYQETIDQNATPAQVMQWILVDEYVACRLSEKGEVTLNLGFSHFWGRQGTGQAYYLDNVIEEIALGE